MEQHLIHFLKKPLVLRSLYFICCMIISFGLGIIVEYSILNRNNTPTIELPKKPVPLAYRYPTTTPQNTYDTMVAEPPATVDTTPTTSPSLDTTKAFTASKTGTKYYPANCGGISRIKPENRIYFATEQEAQDQGYTRTSTCN